ncbi:MAG: AbrB/MazE/SpoVT family DNA-binding domain-containing protein [Terracidiphilus sp.]|jgi:AbrB family looped-hinge helix DNA binding protein
METIYATVSTKGQIVIPARLRESLGIAAGTRVFFRQEGCELILSPTTEPATRHLIQELCGMTAGGNSMADDLIQERNSEDAASGW